MMKNQSTDPLMVAAPAGPLFNQSTSAAAGQQAALHSGSMRLLILDRLGSGPATLFEVAADLGVPDHVISGRFTELARDGWIARTGERRRQPISGCEADIWKLLNGRGRGNEGLIMDQLLVSLGYSPTLKIDGEIYDRQELLPKESLPGVPYARRADTGGARLVVRVALVECEGCARPLKLVVELVNGKEVKTFACGTQGCGRIWHAAIIAEPGQRPVMAMLLRRM
jgi:hypothetical protein